MKKMEHDSAFEQPPKDLQKKFNDFFIGQNNSLIGKDRKIFSPYLSHASVFKAYQIFDEDKAILFSSPILSESNIYFITEHDKVKLITDKSRVLSDGTLILFFLVANKKIIKQTISLFTIWGIQSPHKSFCFGVRDKEHYLYLLKKQKNKGYPTINGIEVDQGQSSEEMLYLNFHQESGTEALEIRLSSILIHLDVSISNNHRILYIGQSKDMKKRISHHEKIQRATSSVHQDKEIYIHCFKYADYRMYQNNLEFAANTIDEISVPAKIDLLELALINHFKPIYNTKLVNTDIPEAKSVKEQLIALGYSALGATVSFDDPFMVYWSDLIPLQKSHSIFYDVDLK